MKVIGTAGHVDHGKSLLVKALTGIDPDRLKEEKEREMTIELGFAWLALPNGDTVSVVDVPGHESFIKNMLAGVGGIDAALLVVAADEGVMPQTREHLAILDLLSVENGVAALTKADLVQDPEWLELVRDDVASALEGTSLAGAKIVPVSARTGQGLEALVEEIQAAVERAPARQDKGKPRLPIDRAFTIAGFGTVVTGTLVDGGLEVGQEVEIVPGEARARVRGLQIHKEKLQRAPPGHRVAANLTGVAAAELERGQVVSLPGQLKSTRLVDAWLRVIEGAPKSLPHNLTLGLFAGAAEVEARVRVLQGKEIQPGGEGWVQLALAGPVAVAAGDRFILRQPSPSLTLGGGVILDPHPRRRYRLNRPETIARLQKLLRGAPRDLVLQALEESEIAPAGEVLARSQLPLPEAEEALGELVKEGEATLLEDPGKPLAARLAISGARLRALAERAQDLVRDYHRAYPLRRGMPKEEIKSRLRVESRPFNALMERFLAEGALRDEGALAALPSHRVAFDEELRGRVDGLLARFRNQPHSPPSVAEAQEAVGNEAFAALLERGDLVRVSDGVAFEAAAYREMVGRIVERLRDQGTITVAEVRDLLGTSRRYALALLEHLDEERVTQRMGDERVLRSSPMREG